jgi:hypothetical protein
MDTPLFKWIKPWHNVHCIYSAQSLSIMVFLLRNQKICPHHYTSLPLNRILESSSVTSPVITFPKIYFIVISTL